MAGFSLITYSRNAKIPVITATISSTKYKTSSENLPKLCIKPKVFTKVKARKKCICVMLCDAGFEVSAGV